MYFEVNKYVIPILFISLGIFIGTNENKIISPYVLNCVNLSAFCFTVSCINYGSIKSKIRDIISKILQVFTQVLGWFFLLATVIQEDFKLYHYIFEIVTSVNANSLLLIGLAATLLSIYIGKDFETNRINNAEKRIKVLEEDINKLKNENLVLKNKYVNIKTKRNQLQENNKILSGSLKDATEFVENLKKHIKRDDN